MKKKNKCFTPSQCCTNSCPNIQCDIAADRWGDYQVAADAGYERIKCKDCHFMTYDCKDCMFENTDMCDKYRVVHPM